MPILAPQADVYPVDLLDRDSSSWLDGAPWVAFYTMARREKDLMRRLAAAEIPFYAPLVKHRSRSPAGRERVAQVPLFPGYVFSQVNDRQRRVALATNSISRSIQVGDALELLEDLRSVKRLVDSGRPLLSEGSLEPGRKVKIRRGPLRGLDGTVLARRGGERFAVSVRFLNRGVSIEMEGADVDPT